MITVYNMLGQVVRIFERSKLLAGRHEIIWDGTYGNGEDAAAGVYFYRLTAEGKFTKTRKMAIIK